MNEGSVWELNTSLGKPRLYLHKWFFIFSIIPLIVLEGVVVSFVPPAGEFNDSMKIENRNVQMPLCRPLGTADTNQSHMEEIFLPTIN